MSTRLKPGSCHRTSYIHLKLTVLRGRGRHTFKEKPSQACTEQGNLSMCTTAVFSRFCCMSEYCCLRGSEWETTTRGTEMVCGHVLGKGDPVKWFRGGETAFQTEELVLAERKKSQWLSGLETGGIQVNFVPGRTHRRGTQDQSCAFAKLPRPGDGMGSL